MAVRNKKKIASKTKAKGPGVRPSRRSPRFKWASWTDQRLLDVPLCDLGVTIEGTWLERAIAQMYGELERRQILVRPHFWLSEEWFCPDAMPGIAIPFFLAHPRLMRLERAQMLEVEGGSRDWCMKILRHETGHALRHVFRLHRRRRWQNLFGHATERYPEFYRPRPRSKRHVVHLNLWYAQSHPDEDFAETFAVWMKPRAIWRKRYEGWPALRKLEYVEELMAELAGKRPPRASREYVEPLRSIKKTLREYYDEKKDKHGDQYPDIYDRDLTRLFSAASKYKGRETASAFLRRNQTEIRKMVAEWTGEYEFTLNQVLHDMIGRSRTLRLRVSRGERQLKLDFAILLTVRTMQYQYTARDWHAL